jgi:hypothetical protein
MAQESVQGTGQQSVQTTVKITRMYRNTEAGGYDKTWVFTVDGQVVKPNVKQRSRSGNHGWDTWILKDGRYAIISITRPNIVNKPKPYTVQLQCAEVANGELKPIVSRTMYVMDWDIEDVKAWARAICP